MASLQDQLLKAGLADKKKAKAIRNEKHKQRKQQPKGAVQVNEAEQRVQQAREEKTERDRQLNQQHQAEAQKKAIQAQIRQLVGTNRLNRSHGESSYQFVHDKKIKKMYVDDLMVDQLARGRLAIICVSGEYEIVAEGVARKIQERDAQAVVVLHERTKDDLGDDDPYAGYEIPDDLMW
ncbi:MULTISPECIES: DUF2058 domain-containing protein [Marinobacter]|jgi:uncharacterized protein YaiL (DUF2058 family)|uniref:Nucleoprotein/polynucleotide-associated enzyme n=1 Tax=Marinobacter psychrophilus TaxID=330734 RepID=A0A0H4IAZ4_9GAMM|nr:MULTISPECIES: DUF2058 domain-containing protein [Marinobacter]AFP30435.1 Uncharacterized protein yaiL [Marinobacter sp. BSs20148]AKO52207.1 nucleoprotein/polynucleotide-associated enzyme [Marinobacter psychrophilus]MBQ0763830.1 DUF2058 domain-containing protein [Marinobacter psychrophilus]MBQ0845895.1 DUF2058 domain-containing protein [Marinobacter psychrophilus]